MSDLLEIRKSLRGKAAKRLAEDARAAALKASKKADKRRAYHDLATDTSLAITGGALAYQAGKEKACKETVKKGLNPFKSMAFDQGPINESQQAILNEHAKPRVSAPKAAKAATRAGGVLGTAAAIGGGIYAARKVAQARAAHAIQQRAAQVAAAKEAAAAEKSKNFKRTAIIGGGTLAGAAAAPTAYKMYREKQGA